VRRRRSAEPTRRWPKRLLLGVLAVLGVVVLLAGAGAAWGLWSFNRLGREDLDLATVEDDEPRNFLVIGSDSRAGVDEGDPGAGVMVGKGAPEGQRSDSIAIMRIDPGEERIDMLSIPRDLWVPIAGTAEEQRINTAYAHSTQRLVDTIQQDLGIPINHYLEVDLVGFQKLVNAIGGVPMYFPNPVRDRNSGLVVKDKGCTVLDGYMSLAFARSRHLQWSDGVRWHTDPTGDLGRMTRQQLLVRAALGKVRDLGLDDIGAVKGIVDAAVDSVTLDSNMGTGDIISLAQRFADFDPDQLQTHSLPVIGHRTEAGAAVVLLDEPAAQPVLDIFRGTSTSVATTTTEPPPSPGDVTVDVLNGSGREGEARRVSYVLTDGGFGTGAVDSAPEPRERTVVRYATGGKAMAELVAAWLGPEPELEEDRDLAAGRVVVTLGADFDRVAEPDPATPAPPAADAVPAGDPATTDTSPTTTTTEPGWTPGPPPAGVRCG
jgi:LCP family protein required for cell wall assembly